MVLQVSQHLHPEPYLGADEERKPSCLVEAWVAPVAGQAGACLDGMDSRVEEDTQDIHSVVGSTVVAERD